MSRTIDQRVVEMQFDNKQFERGVSTTLDTLDKLKQKLNLPGATKGLEDVSAAAKKVDFSGLTNGVDAVQVKFSYLQASIQHQLDKIVDSAVTAGKRMVSALTIDPIKTGFSEYETQINAVQTILANTESKGTTLDQVNSALDELNTYADKTIYNFTEMTRNIGTFTAAGVDLDTSVNAIQGIANLAAVSGSTSQQASTAMYQLSQALSSGTVRLMDWNSVVNAGMGGQVFQDALKETARVHGIAIDDMIEGAGSFRETLQEGWLTADILTETLSHFTMAAEEGSKEWENYKKALMDQGYTEEQALSILKLSNTATDAATKVKTATQLWGTLKETAQSGWTQTWEIIMGDFGEAKELFSGIYNTLGPMLEATAKARNDLLSEGLADGGRENIIKSLYNAFNAVLSVIKPIKEAFSEIFPPITAKHLHDFTENLRKFTERLILGETASNNLKRTFKGLFAIVNIVRKVFGMVFDLLGPLFGRVDDLGGGILGVTAKLGDWLTRLDQSITETKSFEKAVDWVHKAFAKIGEVLKPAIDGIKEFGTTISGAFSTVSDKATERLGPLSVIGKAIGAIFGGLAKVFQTLAPWVASLAGIAGELFSNLMNGITGAIQNADYSGIFDFLNGGIFAAIGIGIAKFTNGIGDSVGSVGDFLDNISGILEGVGDSLSAFAQQLKAKTLLTIASAVAILAAALIALSLVDSEKLTVSLAAVTGLLIELMGAITIFSKVAGGVGLKGMLAMSTMGKVMVSMAKSLLILAVAMKILSSLSWDEVARGLVVTVVGLGAFVGAVNLLPEKKVVSAAKAITKLSVALVIFSGAMKIMGSMSWGEIARGLTGTVVGLAAMVAAVNLLPKGLKMQAIALIGVAAAMVILAGALKIMATMSWEEIAKGLVTLVGALAAVTIATRLLPKSLPLIAAGLLLVSTALVIVAGALKIMGSMSWDEVARGLVALGGSLLIIALGVNAMKGALLGAAAMLVVAAAILVLTPALKMLGSMSLAEIGKGLLALAGVFLIVGVAGLVLGPIVPVILALSAAIALLGVGCAAVGAGMMLFATGIGLLAAALAAGGGAITIFISSLIGLIPYVIEQIGVGIIKLCEVIAGSADAICAAVTVIIGAVVQALVQSVPTIVEGVLVLIVQLLEALVTYTPTIVGYLFDFLIGILNMVAEKLPDLIQAGVNIMMAFFSGVIEALKTIDPTVLVNGILAIGALTALTVAMAGIALLAPAAMVGILAAGALVAELSMVLAAIGGLAQIPGLQWLIGEGGDLLESIGTAIGQFIGGLVGGIAQGMTSSLPEIGTDLSNFMTSVQPFLDGAKAIDPSALEGVKTLIGIILALTGANILESLTSWLTGGSSLTSFGQEIAAFGPYMKAYADAIAGIDASAVTASATAATALSELAANLPNSGGLVGWFAGENDLGAFGTQLIAFGQGLKGYADAVAGIDTAAVTASASAAKTLAEMTQCIPNEGGVAAWFAGDNSISSFANQLVTLGQGLSAYALVTAGIDPVSIQASANAAKSLAEMTQCIPNQGGVAAWFSGDNSISKFANDLVLLGYGLRGFAVATAGIVPENIIAASNAAKALATMTACIPNQGGVVAWFTGDNSLSKFAGQLPALGYGLKGFSDSIAGIVPENVTAAANAAKSLAEMASVIPNQGGFAAWFSGDNSLASFATELVTFGAALKYYSIAAAGVDVESIDTSVKGAKSLVSLAYAIPKSGLFVSDDLSSFATDITPFGVALKAYGASVTGLASGAIDASITAAKKLIDLVRSAEGISSKGTNAFKKAIDNLAKVNVNNFKKAFTDASADLEAIGEKMLAAIVDGIEDRKTALKSAGETVIGQLSEGIKKKTSTAERAAKNVAKDAADAIEDKKSAFKSAGKDLVEGFANGITANTFKATAQARAMAQAALDAAKEALKIKSPSRVFRDEVGRFIPEGFAMGIDRAHGIVVDSTNNMAKTAITNVRDSISRIGEALNGDLNTQPTIRPVLDLSDIRSGAGAIGNMLGVNPSVGVLSNVRAVSSMMNSQNGVNNELISAINKLRKDLGNVGNTSYNINGVTYDDGSNIADAVKSIVRAAKIERRV